MLDPEDRKQLLGVSWRVIEGGVDDPWRRSISPQAYPVTLRAVQASFVTLSTNGALRGCCGQLQASRPLVVDVAHNAWSTAFRDSRFQPLRAAELPGMRLELSLLSPLKCLPQVRSRSDLLFLLEPGRDGLLIRAGGRQATFLPKVWTSLPDGNDFLDHLLQKGGFRNWPETAEFFSYTAECFAQEYGH